MLVDRIWTEQSVQDAAAEPVLAFAIHDGHHLRDDVAAQTALSDSERLREEDPFTGEWTAAAPTRVIGLMSRFQVDLNRPRQSAVYRTPSDAWGLEVWKGDLPERTAAASLREYDEFYGAMERLLSTFEARFGKFVILDLHSYNHRRGGAEAEPADAQENPQVNVGTGSMDRARWGAVADRFMERLRAFDFPGGRLDVRENVKFRGGQFSKWVHRTFPSSGCCLAVEFKKFFMDEWTGEPNRTLVDAIGRAIADTVPALVEELDRL